MTKALDKQDKLKAKMEAIEKKKSNKKFKKDTGVHKQ